MCERCLALHGPQGICDCMCHHRKKAAKPAGARHDARRPLPPGPREGRLAS